LTGQWRDDAEGKRRDHGDKVYEHMIGILSEMNGGADRGEQGRFVSTARGGPCAS
jgi:hypothetical protein